MNAQGRISNASANARTKHYYDDDLKQKQKQKQKHVVRPLLPKMPDGDNVSPSSRDMKIRKADSGSSGRCARSKDG